MLSHHLRKAAALAAFFVATPVFGDTALPDFADAQIVILGEIHDNPDHHDRQAAALRMIAPAAIAFEMLDPDQARIVETRNHAGPALAEAIAWETSGWPDWAIYSPVFGALGEARIYGMALPRAVVRQAVFDGAAAVFPGDASRFRLDEALPDDEQTARNAAQNAAHCDAMPAEMLPGMVEAQRLRDAHFAAIALQALQETGGPVVVIAGTGHARLDWGMPAALRRADPDIRVFALGQIEDGTSLRAPFDAVLSAPAPDRPDPCAVFREGQGG